MTEHERFEVEHADLAADIRATFEEAPRLSPAARRFMAGEMDEWEARQLGYIRDVSEDG